jgi:predicted ribosomally synthesized peptide with nif11-like leader
MSQSDIERFINDLKENTELLGEIKSGSTGLASVVETAQAKGYDITMDEAKTYISDKAQQDLSDSQLDAVAGGKGSTTSTAAVQTTLAVTTAVQTAEAVTTVAEAADVATTVEVVAEAAIVLT